MSSSTIMIGLTGVIPSNPARLLLRSRRFLTVSYTSYPASSSGLARSLVKSDSNLKPQQPQLLRGRAGLTSGGSVMFGRIASSASSGEIAFREASPSACFSTSRRGFASQTTSEAGTVHDKMLYSPIFVAATRQHVGKTSVSLALMSGLVKRFQKHRVGFMKPVGQKYLTVQEPNSARDGSTVSRRIDKDAVLIKTHFALDQLNWVDTSPVLIPDGYTKQYLDNAGEQFNHQIEQIQSAYANLTKQSDVVLCEGTGHCAVGAIIDASNADVASLLGAHMVLVANGGLGNAFDELSLNRNWCLERNVPIAGIIINQIRHDKFDQTVNYLRKAMEQKWSTSSFDTCDVPPLLGCIPDRPFLGCAALSDMERLFNATIITGEQHRLRHYRMLDISLVATSLEVFLKQLRNPLVGGRTLFVCHASRTDILLGYLMESIQRKTASSSSALPSSDKNKYEPAMIVTGCNEYPISTQVLEIITSLPTEFAPPVLLTDAQTDVVVSGLYRYTPKLNIDDQNRVTTAIAHYEPFINFDLLLNRVSRQQKLAAPTSLPEDASVSL